MDVNENIALVVLGLNDNSLVNTRQIEKNTKSLLQLWTKYSYTVITVDFDISLGYNGYATSYADTRIVIENEESITTALTETLRITPYKRLIMTGVVEDRLLENVLQFAEANRILLYQVSDAILFDANSTVRLDALIKEVTTKQIMTLSKSIRDKE
jgi:hypothetical protein